MGSSCATIQECCAVLKKELGQAHSEAVYHRALEVELRTRHIPYESERVVPVTYRQHVVGSVRVDLIVDKEVVVELKAVARLLDCHEHQTRKYMQLLGLREGLLLNMHTEESRRFTS